MDVEQAERVRIGDVVVYGETRPQVIGVSHDGLWAPYFVLDDDGTVSHLLVQPAQVEAASGSA